MDVRLTFIDLAGDALPQDFVVSAPAGSSAATLAPLVRQLSGRAEPAELFVGGMPLAAVATIGTPPLVDGAVVTVGRAGVVAARAVRGLLELHVVGGPDCGQVFRLAPGSRQIGRAAGAGVRIDDRDLSRVHAELNVGDDGVHVRDLGSSNGTWIEGEMLGSEPALLPVGARLVLGTTTLVVRLPGSAPAAVTATDTGTLSVNRSPRTLPPVLRPEIRLPDPPESRDRLRLPVLAALVPLAMAAVLALVTRSTTMLLFGVMSPVMMAGSYVSDRRSGRRGSAAARTAYDLASGRADAALGAALRAEALSRRAELPDRAALLMAAEAPGTRLWERRRDDDDVLTLRLGTRDMTSRVVVVDHLGGHVAPDVMDVPVPINLAVSGVIGVSGPRGPVLGVVRGLLADVCGWHSPADLSLVVLAASVGLGADWAWTANLPHTRPDHGQPCHNLVGIAGDGGAVGAGAAAGAAGADDRTLLRRVAELAALIRDRQPTVTGLGPGHWAGARTVVLLDGAQRLRAVPGVAQLLEQGPSVGVYFLCLDELAARLPVETRAEVHVGSPVIAETALLIGGAAPLVGVTADAVSRLWVERFARALAPLRDATPDADNRGLPETARLVDFLGIAPEDSVTLAERWRRRPQSTLAVLGVTADDRYRIDLARDGPHVLVGGTTGSGKSELLQTLIASLALVNRPDRLSFVLVDYKGGAAFRDCARLPHTVGVVTDLDQQLTERALTSLGAELRRREGLLRDRGAKDLDEYQSLARASDPVISRLVLVIDEFKMLAEELPAFVEGLVRVAALGRSLGVHLVLATQRPGGIVSADIKANVNLRIALRVRDRSDSEDVVGAPDAANIPEGAPGRAVARSGSQALVAFQSARVAGSAGPAVTAEQDLVGWERLPWSRVGDPPAARADPPSGSRSTDLSNIALSCLAAASELGIGPVPSPWLPPLPSVILTSALSRLDERAWRIPYALVDLPREQAQLPLCLDLEDGTHLALAGMARSGRTTALRTLAATIAGRLSPADVHLYAIDGGSGGLAALSVLPHTGAVVSCGEPARLDRLVTRLREEVESRQGELSRQGHSSLAEQRSHAESGGGHPLPYVVLLVDGWENVVDALEGIDHGRPVDTLLRVLRDGAGVGVRAVLTGDRSVLLSRLSAVVPDKLVLRMADPGDLVLAGIAPRDLPSHLPPGRAVRAGDGAEVQVAVLTADLAGPAQLAALQQRGEDARARWPQISRADRPFRVEPLPTKIYADKLEVSGARVALAWALVGVGGDDLGPVGIDLSRPGSAALVAGPSGSGRSSTLRTMALWLAAHGTPVGVVNAGRSALAGIVGTPGVCGAVGPTDDATVQQWASQHTGLVVFVDDGERLLDSSVEQVLLSQLRRGDAANLAVVCSGRTAELSSMFRGLTIEVRKQGQGVLLNPASFSDGDLLGLRIGARDQAQVHLPGRGLLVGRGAALPLQVALTP